MANTLGLNTQRISATCGYRTWGSVIAGDGASAGAGSFNRSFKYETQNRKYSGSIPIFIKIPNGPTYITKIIYL